MSGRVVDGSDDDAESMERVCRVFSEILSVGFTAIPNGPLERWRADFVADDDDHDDEVDVADETDVDRICAALRRMVGLCGEDGDDEGENAASCARSVHISKVLSAHHTYGYVYLWITDVLNLV